MSTKTIALESSVYDRLSLSKRPSESFTKAIERLLTESRATTCGQALVDAAEIWGDASPTESEARVMDRVLAKRRKKVDWKVEEPR